MYQPFEKNHGCLFCWAYRNTISFAMRFILSVLKSLRSFSMLQCGWPMLTTEWGWPQRWLEWRGYAECNEFHPFSMLVDNVRSWITLVQLVSNLTPYCCICPKSPCSARAARWLLFEATPSENVSRSCQGVLQNGGWKLFETICWIFCMGSL